MPKRELKRKSKTEKTSYPQSGTRLFNQLGGNYLDLPWSERTPNDVEIKNAEKILDTEHYGLKEVKDRILEYMAVMKLKNKDKKEKERNHPHHSLFRRASGVGKTSIGKSIAHALGRKIR